MALSKSDRINLRCSPFEKLEWGKAAGGSGKISEWLRSLANQESARVNALPGSGSSGNGYIEENLGSGTPSDAASAGESKARGVISGQRAASGGGAKAPSSECLRWFHHRSGTYCSHCERVIP